MIKQLKDRGLIRVYEIDGKEMYSIHRLLQQKIVLDMDEIQFENAFRKTFRLIRKRYPTASPKQVPDPSSWGKCEEYMRHVFSFHRVFSESPQLRLHKVFPDKEKLKPSIELARLFYDAGFYVWARQTTAYDGLPFLETAEKILDEMNIDGNAKIRADIHCITGLIYMRLGSPEREQSLARLEDALKIREQIYVEHPDDRDCDVLFRNAAVDFGLCLLDENDFQKAGQNFQECFERYKEWGDEADIPFEYGKYYGNVSIVLMWQGDIDKAMDFVNKSIELCEKFQGRAAQYWRRQFLLACILLQAGRVDESLALHIETRAARLDLLGKHHQSTILSTYAVGALYHAKGDLENAMYVSVPLIPPKVICH
jgi:hypothetical protein